MAEKDAYRKALELLARRAHFEREIERKLAARGFDEAACSHAVERLRGDGYLDDERCALEFVRSKLRRSPLGRRRLLADLTRRGARQEAIEAVLEGGDFAPEIDRAREAVERWQRRGGRSSASLMRFLDRRGFSKGDILTVVDELPDVDPSP